MRAPSLLLLLIVLTGITAAQSTNFPVGPQYLITTDSTLFLGPIATPSLSLEPMPPPAVPAAPTEPQNGVTLAWQPPPPSSNTYLPSVYWGERWVNHVLGVEEESSVIEINSSEPIQNLPAGLFDPGVAGVSDAESLHAYIAPLGDTAKLWKARKPSGRRVYTNDDLKH